MSDKNRDSCRAWLRKADHDLIAGCAIQNFSDSPTDVMCFHAHQAVEKALKALLTYHGITFTKTHYLKILLQACVPFLPNLESFQESFVLMTNCAVMARYPDWDDDQLSRDQVLTWLRLAEHVVTLVRNHCE